MTEVKKNLLSEADLKQLNLLDMDPGIDRKYKIRIRTLLLRNEGKKYSEIGDILGIDTTYAGKFCRNYLKYGLKYAVYGNNSNIYATVMDNVRVNHAPIKSGKRRYLLKKDICYLNSVINNNRESENVKLAADILLLRNTGKSYADISAQLSTPVSTVVDTWLRYLDDGVDAALYGSLNSVVLTDEERAVLTECFLSGENDRKSKERAGILLLTEKTTNLADTAQKIGCSISTVCKCIQRYYKSGISSTVPSFNRVHNAMYNEAEKPEPEKVKDRRNLLINDICYLNSIINNPESLKNKKSAAQILLLRNYGKSYSIIADQLSISTATVYDTWWRYLHDGVDAALSGINMVVLTGEERTALTECLLPGKCDHMTGRRAEILLLSEKTADRSEIAQKIGCTVKTVSKCISNYYNGGINAVVPSSIRAQMAIVTYINSILDMESPSGLWSITTLLSYIKEHAVHDGHPELASISYDRLQSLLKKRGINSRSRGFSESDLRILMDVIEGKCATVTTIVTRRAAILLKRAKGMTQKEIANELKIHERTVSRCISKYLDVGLEKTLFVNPKVGRPSKKK